MSYCRNGRLSEEVDFRGPSYPGIHSHVCSPRVKKFIPLALIFILLGFFGP